MVSPDAVAFPRDSRTDGTLKLQIASGRGPQAQAMSQVIIDRVNANFGYQAIRDYKLYISKLKAGDFD